MTAATSSTVAKKRAASTSGAVPKKVKTQSKSPDSQPSISRTSSSRRY
jgi:hypothetical protein